ncbi:tetratricopeptide repeat protein [Allochromatium humboldtianum]|uniref:protein O-GlcNAc transferase n=1 Tax=Allochromatium humboldtianum TaxID=504901 RepID=A0A850R8S1_9GAMM|nr:tetratricopeptide repeat protein [Allochromatium humboldtianum]NVZ10284.1 tetratricopeptide repeat protein [Allochromatium humboldtianum]
MKKIILARQNVILKLISEKKNHDAEIAARSFILKHPENDFGWKALGALLFFRGEFQESLDFLLKAVSINNKDPECLNALGNTLMQLGRIKESLDCFDRALEINSNCASAHNGKGLILSRLKRTEEAIESFRKSLKLQPNQIEPYYNLGVFLIGLGRIDEGIELNRHALELNPNCIEALNNLAMASQDLCKLDEALYFYEQAINLEPQNKSICSNRLFVLNYHPTKSKKEIFSYYQDFDNKFGICYQKNWHLHKNTPNLNRRLHIGYFSPDFCIHSTRHSIEPIFENHNHDQFKITAYAEQISTDFMTARYRKLVDCWINTNGLTDEALSQRIQDDQIDILVDLAGHTANNRLGVFARRPAPISVTWMGYGYTTGLSAIDYFLTDTVTVPPEEEKIFSEKIWYLDTPAGIYRPSNHMGETNKLPALQKKFITFGALTRGIRINFRVIRVWSEILRKIPKSRLIINSKSFVTSFAKNKLIEQFVEHGIERERLEIGYNTPPWDILRNMDIGLDCFPHNSGTTLHETLYMGVPFITLADRPSVGRIGSSILTGIGHPEWIANTEKEYVDKAIMLADDLNRLAEIRKNLRFDFESSPWRDEKGFTQRLEKAYREMWKIWCNNNF